MSKFVLATLTLSVLLGILMVNLGPGLPLSPTPVAANPCGRQILNQGYFNQYGANIQVAYNQWGSTLDTNGVCKSSWNIWITGAWLEKTTVYLDGAWINETSFMMNPEVTHLLAVFTESSDGHFIKVIFQWDPVTDNWIIL